MATAVVGLGNIGAEVGVRLAHRVGAIGIDPTRERREEWARRSGGRTARDITDVDLSDVSRVLVIVRSSRTALQVAQQLSGNVSSPLTCHIMTTLDVEDARSLGTSSFHPDLTVLEQPVSGGAVAAREGRLTVLSAGPSDEGDTDFLLDHLARTVMHFADYGAPTVAKLLNNTVATYHLEVALWALREARSQGISPGTMHEVLQSSSGASAISGLVEDMEPDQGALLDKDVALLRRAAGELPSISLPEHSGEAAVRELRRLISPE